MSEYHSDLAGRRVVVVGATAGIGRSFARCALASGADVVLAARRRDVLDTMIADAGTGTAVALDIADRAGRAAFVSVVGEGPPVDLVLVTVGVADLCLLRDVDEERWMKTLSTNLIGVARLIEDLRPLLTPTGIVAVTSSETGRVPRKGLVHYGASKAALDAVLAGLRTEHVGLRISCIVLGATYPTEFGDSFDPDQLSDAMTSWQAHGLLPQEFMCPDEVGAVLLDVYSTALRHPSVGIEEIALQSPSPVLGIARPG